MIRRIAPLFFLVFPGLHGCGSEDEPQPDLHVHFVGNSYTNTNGLPRILEHLVRAAGKEPGLVTSMTVKGGAQLKGHWDAGLAPRLIREQSPDIVVLQEKSMLPLTEGGRATMHEYVRRFSRLASEAEAEVVLFMTWARFDEAHNLEPLAEAYDSIAKELGLAVAPVGVAFRATLDEWLHPYRPDGSHPNVLGSYLAACLLFAVIYGEDPRSLPADALAAGLPAEPGQRAVRLPADVASVLQRIAGEVAIERGLLRTAAR